MGFVADNGAVITDEMLDRLAAEYESGDWPERTDGQVTLGRPRITGEELVNITFRMPKSKAAVIEGLAKKSGKSRSDFLRTAVDRAIVEQSL